MNQTWGVKEREEPEMTPSLTPSVSNRKHGAGTENLGKAQVCRAAKQEDSFAGVETEVPIRPSRSEPQEGTGQSRWSSEARATLEI